VRKPPKATAPQFRVLRALAADETRRVHISPVERSNVVSAVGDPIMTADGTAISAGAHTVNAIIRRGWINTDGYITPAGRKALAEVTR